MSTFLKIISKILNLFFINLSFLKPKKHNFVIYDAINSLHLRKKLSKFGNVFVYDNRNISLNFYVFFFTIINFGFFNIKKNYKKSLFRFLSPKIILTFMDTNPAFYLLKEDLDIKNFKTIRIQNGNRNEINFLNFKKKNKKNYSCDYFFIYYEYSKNLYNKYINCDNTKFITIGSFLNNEYPIKNTNLEKDYLDIIYISQFREKNIGDEEYAHEKKIMDVLQKYVKTKKINLIIGLKSIAERGISFNFLEKIIYGFSNIKKIYKKHFIFEEKIKFVGNDKKNSNYHNLDKADLVIFESSSLGLEAIARGKKVLSIPMVKKDLYPHQEDNFQDQFVCETVDQNILEKKIDYLLDLNQREWLKMSNKSLLNMAYDGENQKFMKVIDDII